MSKVIGYTTGVFDLFHVGHVNILKNAKSQCEHLIVGCTTDEIVLQRKNKTPIIPLNERMQILQSIKYVDEVVVQDSMNKMAALNKYKFNVMFVGDDWKGSPSWNIIEDEFNKLNVKIVYFPYTKSTSSTKINKILDDYITQNNL